MALIENCIDRISRDYNLTFSAKMKLLNVASELYVFHKMDDSDIERVIRKIFDCYKVKTIFNEEG